MRARRSIGRGGRRRVRRGGPAAALRAAAVALALGLPGAAWAATTTPLDYLSGAGEKTNAITPLLWFLIWVSIAVVVIIGGLVLVGALLRRARRSSPAEVPPERTRSGLSWITIGVGLSTIALLVATVWTVSTSAAINEPDEPYGLTLAITGHQWWWEVEYRGDTPSETFETANEIHIPVGVPVRIELRTADVIHSFWVPALTGKTDLIPNITNVTWIEADHAGVYRGQCTEYCGRQHAHMGLVVYADEPQAFEAWRQDQLAPAATPDAELQVGLAAFTIRCGACHTVRGTAAGGQLGPDLSHLASRSTIAAATLPNTIGHLSGWIADPQGVKPGNLMPRLDLMGTELDAIRTYLLSLT